MVFLPTRTSPQNDASESCLEPFSRGARVIIDLLDVVNTIRDGDHLQCAVFLAQEFGLLSEHVFLFGATGAAPHRPHSLLLEGHFYALLRDGIVDLDGTGRLRLRRDLFALPPSGLAARRLAALSALSPHEAAIFAAAVLNLAGAGRHAGSRRHDGAFEEAVAHLAACGEDNQSIDVTAIGDARRRLMPVAPVLLTPT